MGITIIETGIDGNKWPFKQIDYPRFEEALSTVLNEDNWPCLIHCNKGKHRTGCLVASLRLVRGWALSPTFAEYMLFSGARQRLEDQIFVETFFRHHVALRKQQVGEEKQQEVANLVLDVGAPTDGTVFECDVSNEGEEDVDTEGDERTSGK